MQCHDHQISGKNKEITKLSQHCHHQCLHFPHLVVASTTIEGSVLPITMVIPEAYHKFLKVFSNKKASGIPPHRPYICTTNLLPGTMPTQNCIYPLSLTEQRPMDDYVQEAFQQRYIYPSTSPSSVGFFFVEKKGGGLHLCIDYHGPSQIAVN